MTVHPLAPRAAVSRSSPPDASSGSFPYQGAPVGTWKQFAKRDGGRDHGILAVAIDDHRLTWPERELVKQLGERLYGKRTEERRDA